MQRRFIPVQAVIFFVLSFLSLKPVYAEEIHTVKRGETLYSIALDYGVSMDALMKLNNISDPKKLWVGTKLKIPQKLSVERTTSAGNTSGATQYTVVKGDTLFGIARKYGITVAELRTANGFSSSYILKTGDKLRIPAPVVSQAVVPPAVTPPPVPPPAAPSGVNPLPKYNGVTWPVNVRSMIQADGKLTGGLIITTYASEPVRSLTKGTVKAVGPYFNFRNVVVVESAAGYLYTYGGCDRLSVRIGDRVGVGTELGRLDTNSSPQLLLMVSKDNRNVNPATAPRD